jgi:Zn-dependent protease with chaperone function
MNDLAKDLGLAATELESFGRALVERFGLLNLWTALLLGGALVLDLALSRRMRASLRIALYAPLALRIVLPLDWSLGLTTGPRVATVFAPLLRLEATSAEAPAGHAPAWYALAAVLYSAVATLLAVRAIGARIRLDRALAEARPVSDLHAAVPCPVVEHDHLGPMAVGLLAPLVVIPSRLFVAGEEHALACVLRHEATHLRRRDAWLSAAMQLLAVTAWPVLPLWIAIARVRQLMELACDDAALTGADEIERRRYGHALLDMAEWRLVTTAPFGAGELHFGSTLRARVDALVSQRHWPLGAQAIALSFASIALFIACGGSAPQPATPSAKTGYGYEFKTTTVADVSAAAAPPENQLATGPGGQLFPESIENVVRGHFGQLLNCYEQGRRKDPQLKGKVTVKFVIGEDGITKEATDAGSTLPDKDVVNCVVAAFRQRKYRESHGGPVTVVYPVQFGP